MIYNYNPGVTEILTLESIGTNAGVNTVIKVDGYYTNILADLNLYTDSGGVTQVPVSSYAITSIDSTVTNLEVGKTNKTAYKTYIVTDPTYQGVSLWATFTNFGTYTDNQATVDLVNAFIGSTKVLWTGPLSVVSTPTSLDVGEAFSDWDLIEVDFNLTSDTGLGATTAQVGTLSSGAFRAYSDVGNMIFNKISDTTFEITIKTITAGNIQKIIGIKL